MKIALDIDDTVTAHPHFFYELFKSWLAVGHGAPVFLTARPSSQARDTRQMLEAMGFHDPLLFMYPEEYTWPFRDAAHALETKKKHAAWKAKMCVRLEIDVLVDDCHHNVAACQAAGIFVLHVKSPERAKQQYSKPAEMCHTCEALGMMPGEVCGMCGTTS